MPYYARKDVGGLAPDANELYYNILVKNNSVINNPGSFNSLPAIPISFQETRSNPYIGTPSDYYMSIVAFECDTQTTPVFICDTIPGSIDINSTIYNVTLYNSNTGLYFTQPVVWKPEDTTAPLPPSPVPDNYNKYPYYYASSYTWFISLVNIAIAAAYAGAGGVSTKPFIQFQDGMVSMLAGKNQFHINVGVWKVFFNTALYQLFSGFTYTYQGNYVLGGTPNKSANYLLNFDINPLGTNIVKVYTNLAEVPLSSSYNAIKMDSTFSPLPYWNPVSSIVFTAQQLDLVPELIAKPTLYGQGNPQYSGVNANTDYILADYSAPLITGTEYKPGISYAPLAEFRLVGLYGDKPLYSININVYWKDTFGDLHPLLLAAGGTAYIKIMFRNKNFYSKTD